MPYLDWELIKSHSFSFIQTFHIKPQKKKTLKAYLKVASWSKADCSPCCRADTWLVVDDEDVDDDDDKDVDDDVDKDVDKDVEDEDAGARAALNGILSLISGDDDNNDDDV